MAQFTPESLQSKRMKFRKLNRFLSSPRLFRAHIYSLPNFVTFCTYFVVGLLTQYTTKTKPILSFSTYSLCFNNLVTVLIVSCWFRYVSKGNHLLYGKWKDNYGFFDAILMGFIFRFSFDWEEIRHSGNLFVWVFGTWFYERRSGCLMMFVSA